MHAIAIPMLKAKIFRKEDVLLQPEAVLERLDIERPIQLSLNGIQECLEFMCAGLGSHIRRSGRGSDLVIGPSNPEFCITLR
jgi:hypothetical protein